MAGPADAVTREVAIEEPIGYAISKIHYFNKILTIVTIDGVGDFFIGTQIATLLKRETFNLYRSLKVKHVQVIRCEQHTIEWLIRCRAVKRGTRSATLIEYDGTMALLCDEHSHHGKSHHSSITSEIGADMSLSEFEGQDSDCANEPLPRPWEILASMAFDRNFGPSV